MAWLVGIGMALGLLALVYGAVSVPTGWTLPWTRRHLTHPRLHGLGAALIGLPVLAQGMFYFGILPDPSWEARFFGLNLLLLSGLALLAFGQLLPPRKADGTSHR
ncbi:hypothetical protein [Streptomyces sp. NPDC003374]